MLGFGTFFFIPKVHALIICSSDATMAGCDATGNPICMTPSGGGTCPPNEMPTGCQLSANITSMSCPNGTANCSGNNSTIVCAGLPPPTHLECGTGEWSNLCLNMAGAGPDSCGPGLPCGSNSCSGSFCGDGMCADSCGEDSTSCPQDCPSGGGGGGGTCQAGQNGVTCCGDGDCSGGNVCFNPGTTSSACRSKLFISVTPVTQTVNANSSYNYDITVTNSTPGFWNNGPIQLSQSGEPVAGGTYSFLSGPPQAVFQSPLAPGEYYFSGSATTYRFTGNAGSAGAMYNISFKVTDTGFTPNTASQTVNLGVGACNRTTPGSNQMVGCVFDDTSAPPLAVVYGNAPDQAAQSAPADNATVISQGPPFVTPLGSISVNYSLRYQGTFTFSGGGYTFTIRGEDGYRLYVDSNLLYDNWNYQGASARTVTANLSAGTHTIKLEHFDGGGYQSTSLSWVLTTPLPAGASGTLNGTDYTGAVQHGSAMMADARQAPLSQSQSTLSWTTSNASSCSISGTDGFSYVIPASSLASGSTKSLPIMYNNPGFTYTLNCVGTDGITYNNLDNITLNAPPPPTSVSAVCRPDGSNVDVSWTLPSGYTLAYTRAKAGANNITWPPDWAASSVAGNTWSFPSAPSQSYSYWVHTQDSATGAYSNLVGGNVTCAAPAPVGTCGTANGKTYAPGTTTYGSDTQCGNGTPTNTSFPAAGTTVTWTCNDAGGNSGTCTASTGAVPPPTPNAVCNSSNAANCQAVGGTDPLCQQVKITWSYANASATYNVYRDGVKINSNPIGPNVYYDVVNTTDNNPHTYAVTTILNGVESSQAAWAGNPVSSISCSADLSTSDKDITAINGVSLSPAPTACNNKTDALPNSTTLFQVGDLVTFKINICNNAPTLGGLTASGVSVADTVTNLTAPAGGWTAQFCNGSSCSDITPTVSGSSPNETLSFNLNNASYNIPPQEIRNIIITGKVAPPATSVLYGRFQNVGRITYTGGTKLVNTPLILFYNGTGVPTRNEH